MSIEKAKKKSALRAMTGGGGGTWHLVLRILKFFISFAIYCIFPTPAPPPVISEVVTCYLIESLGHSDSNPKDLQMQWSAPHLPCSTCAQVQAGEMP